MPRKQRFAKARNVITHGQISHLITGYDYFGDGFGGRDTPLDEDAMREAWIDNRQAVIEHQRADVIRSDWPIYAELFFDRGMSRQEALLTRRKQANA